MGWAASSSVAVIIAAHKERYIFLVVLNVKPQFPSAIGAVKQVTEHIAFPIFRLRITTAGFADQFLHLFKHLTINNRFVDIFENRPLILGISIPCFVLEGFRAGFEVDNIPAVFLLCKNFRYRCLAPLVRIRLCFLAASRQPFALPICHRDKHLFLLQDAGDRFCTLAL